MSESPEDDWFSGSDLGVPLARSPVEDDWLEEDLGPGSLRSFDLSSLADRRVLVSAGVGIVLLLSVLFAVGVFSGGGAPRANVPIVTTPAAAPVKTTTPVVQSTVGLPAGTLKPGATGAQVTLLQRALKSLGYSAGALDGNYGPATTGAVSAFQRASGLTADGVFGPKTLQGLTRAVAARGG
jgi:Putative peptidoglycan binding domain